MCAAPSAWCAWRWEFAPALLRACTLEHYACRCFLTFVPGIGTAHAHLTSVASVLSVGYVSKSASPTQQVPWHRSFGMRHSAHRWPGVGRNARVKLRMRRDKLNVLALTCGPVGV